MCYSVVHNHGKSDSCSEMPWCSHQLLNAQESAREQLGILSPEFRAFRPPGRYAGMLLVYTAGGAAVVAADMHRAASSPRA